MLFRSTHSGDQNIQVLSIADVQKMSSFYSSILVRVRIIPASGTDQTFSVGLQLQIPDYDYGSTCTAGTKCPLGNPTEKTINSGTLFDFKVTEAKPQIPLLMTGLNLDSSIDHQYFINIQTSATNYDVSYNVFVKSRIFTPLALIIAIAGAIVTIFGFIRQPAGGRFRPIPTRPAYEPSIGGGGNGAMSSKASKRSKNSKKGKPVASKRATPNACKKCGGVMPRNAQYCPHCYTRQ